MPYSFYRLCFIAALVFMFAFGQYEVIFPFARGIAFNAYLSYYNPVVKGILSGAESFMASMNILLFTVYMILLVTKATGMISSRPWAEGACPFTIACLLLIVKTTVLSPFVAVTVFAADRLYEKNKL